MPQNIYKLLRFHIKSSRENANQEILFYAAKYLVTPTVPFAFFSVEISFAFSSVDRSLRDLLGLLDGSECDLAPSRSIIFVYQDFSPNMTLLSSKFT